MTSSLGMLRINAFPQHIAWDSLEKLNISELTFTYVVSGSFAIYIYCSKLQQYWMFQMYLPLWH